jgi:hypothetical protein
MSSCPSISCGTKELRREGSARRCERLVTQYEWHRVARRERLQAVQCEGLAARSERPAAQRDGWALQCDRLVLQHEELADQHECLQVVRRDRRQVAHHEECQE